MRIQTILNFAERHPRFVYGHATLQRSGAHAGLHVKLQPKKGCWPICSGCGKRRRAYDKLTARHYRYLSMFATVAVYFVYCARRCDCPRCGVTIEMLPWSASKSPITHALAWYLASWAKALPWQEVARRFDVSWAVVFRAVDMAVTWGLKHRDLSGITAIGVDEISRRKGQVYFTMVYQIDNGCRRLLWIGRDRTAATFRTFFDELGDRSKSIRFIATDMWKAFVSVAKERIPEAVHVLDRFHIAKLSGEALDEVRCEEARTLKAKGRGEVLKRTRWLLLKLPKNRTRAEGIRLQTLLRDNLRTVRGYILHDVLRGFWDLKNTRQGKAYLDNWCYSARHSRLKPFKRLASTLEHHRALILNWFKAKDAFAKGATEGLNTKARVVTRRAYGYRVARVAEIALFHAMGKLPEPPWVTHRFK
jgi:transposase